MKRHWFRLQLKFEAPNAVASGGLMWQYIAIIATFSSYFYTFVFVLYTVEYIVLFFAISMSVSFIYFFYFL